MGDTVVKLGFCQCSLKRSPLRTSRLLSVYEIILFSVHEIIVLNC